uniref:Uncharacterized protein n=1 Tax=Oryza rufipogon TaxID=4529 RepID=A0A0E0NTG4_ORYRU
MAAIHRRVSPWTTRHSPIVTSRRAKVGNGLLHLSARGSGWNFHEATRDARPHRTDSCIFHFSRQRMGYHLATTTTVDGGDDGMVEDPSKAGSPVPIAAVRSGAIDSRRLVAAAAKMAPRRQSLPRSLVLRKVMTLDYLMTMRQSSLPPALLSYPLHPPRHQPSYHRRKRADSSTMRGSAWR